MPKAFFHSSQTDHQEHIGDIVQVLLYKWLEYEALRREVRTISWSILHLI
jgi:hypothetical protein